MRSIIHRLSKYKIVPVVTINDSLRAVKLAETLMEKRLPIIEITFRTETAADCIHKIRQSFPEMLIGAGTILTKAQASTARQAGADFVVAPGFNPATVDYCLQNNIWIIPGVDSPSLIEAALEKGIHLVKFFPAQQSGGVSYLKAIAAPYKEVRFMPTGGISEDNLHEYLAFEKVIACGGSWMVPPSQISADDFNRVGENIKAALAIAKTK